MINPKIRDYLNSPESYNQRIGIILAIGEGVSINDIVEYLIHSSKCWTYQKSKFDYWYNATILGLDINVGIVTMDTYLYVEIGGKMIYGVFNCNGEYYDEHDNFLHSTLFRYINITVRDFISSIKI